ncbi:hypothetical protein [Klenkia sp. PcliD-1-E]|uniref:hypothetical protein n=1 Tax=Klenkia sp. PcliD-1-E TaxID=2954492 RepID=UPI0020975CEF|nr:hypothetical protein [Klenkia sp. PcliD-1-E]MCO7219302.1 hypothetical protein [Klenkia sp. PcliD-1-E]
MDTAAALTALPDDAPGTPALHLVGTDPEQLFVTRLRSSANHFAAAAGATSAVVREAVPPARHRRSRCRVVLRWEDGAESDVTFLGPARHATVAGPAALAATTSGFDVAIQQWLTEGRPESPLWLVPDEDSPAGTAVDVAAWLST